MSQHCFDYQSVYGDDEHETWHSRAVVRASQRVCLDEPFDAAGSQLFSPAVTEFAEHPHVAALGPLAVARVRWGRLSDYLSRTERVEIEIVNRALTQLLAMHDLPQPLKTDLLKIYTDEGYHVLMMSEFGHELQEVTGFRLPRRAYRGLDDLRWEINRLSGDDVSLACTTCAIVTETLISGTLRKANDESVFAPVRAILSDHARDESYHHASFYRLAKCMLPRLTDRERELVEYVARVALRNFLMPDAENIVEDLADIGLTGSQIEEVTASTLDAGAVRASLLSDSVATRRLFEQVGIPISI